MKRPCVFLVADGTTEAVFTEFLGRAEWHQSLGCGCFPFDPTQDLVVDALGNDPGVYERAHLLLAPYLHTHRRAVVILDNAWEGSPGPAAISERIEAKMQQLWEQFAVVVIDPELETWIWQDSPHVAEAFRYKGDKSLRQWLEEAGEWPNHLAKPTDPKGAAEKVLRLTGRRISSGVYRKVVSRVSVRRCTDPAFLKLTEVLRTWFPPEAP